MTMGFSCAQHQCWDCEQKTQDTGGMIFRCRWCERGYCEDCLAWDKTKLIGDNLKEYELLDFPSVTQAYYVCCPCCTEHHQLDPTAKNFCTKQAQEIDKQYGMMLEDQDAKMAISSAELDTETSTPSPTQSLTDASTIDGSTVATPYGTMDDAGASSKRKRKAAPSPFNMEMLPVDDLGSAGAALDNSDSYASSTKKRIKASGRFALSSSPLGAR